MNTESIEAPPPTAAELLAEAVGVTGQTAKASIKLVEAEIGLRRSLLDGLISLNEYTEQWDKASAAYLKNLREFRMAAITEVGQAKNALADIRKFFLAREHEEEVKRLREFVELCERLEVLKKNGTLDALADTIIKLA